jgi:hypothetical protein
MKSELITLPIQVLALLQNQMSNAAVWNISKIIIGKNNKNHEIVNGDTLKVLYPKGSYSPSKMPQGGIGFYASPREVFPSKEVVLKYEVYFNNTFNPVYGGKLPGLYIGSLTARDFKGASGGKYSNTSASIRIAWRKNLIGEAYLYVPRLYQLEGFERLPGFVRNGKYGDSIWRGAFKFEKELWNKVTIRVKLNDVSKANGELEIDINGGNQRYNEIVWRTNEDVGLREIIFETFFGGSTIKYATPVDTHSYFRNVQIQALN